MQFLDGFIWRKKYSNLFVMWTFNRYFFTFFLIQKGKEPRSHRITTQNQVIPGDHDPLVCVTLQTAHRVCTPSALWGPMGPDKLCLSFSGLLYLVINSSLLQEVLQDESLPTVLSHSACGNSHRLHHLGGCNLCKQVQQQLFWLRWNRAKTRQPSGNVDWWGISLRTEAETVFSLLILWHIIKDVSQGAGLYWLNFCSNSWASPILLRVNCFWLCWGGFWAALSYAVSQKRPLTGLPTQPVVY